MTTPDQHEVRQPVHDPNEHPGVPTAPGKPARPGRRRHCVDPDAPPRVWTPELWSAARLMETDFPTPKWAVPGILCEGLSLLAGPPALPGIGGHAPAVEEPPRNAPERHRRPTRTRYRRGLADHARRR